MTVTNSLFDICGEMKKDKGDNIKGKKPKTFHLSHTSR
jgi:hypothetical protein